MLLNLTPDDVAQEQNFFASPVDHKGIDGIKGSERDN
jgi:hypothetical protein